MSNYIIFVMLFIIVGVVVIGIGIGIGFGLTKIIPGLEIGYALIAGAVFSVGIIDLFAKLNKSMSEVNVSPEIDFDESEDEAHIIVRKPPDYIPRRRKKNRR